MGVSEALKSKREEQLMKMPIIETRIFKSNDNKFLIHKTVITDIKPVEYYRVVLEKQGSAADNVGEEVEEDVGEEAEQSA